MNYNFLLGLLVGYFMPFIENLFVEPIRKKWRKQCNYDCSKCKVWDCDKKVCDFKKLKYLSKKDGVDNEED